jgi:hypothetical protein
VSGRKAVMITALRSCALAISISVICGLQAAAADAVPVTADNFMRAESDLYFGSVAKKYGLGDIRLDREPTPLDQQTVIRMNRDTLYGAGVSRFRMLRCLLFACSHQWVRSARVRRARS